MQRFLSLLVLILVSGTAAAQTAGPARTQQLTDEIKAADLALFSAFFDRCDVKALEGMVTDDFEMFHDKGGRTGSKADFLKGITGTCERQKTGEDYRARRELIASTLKVYPLNNYGAVETGEHRFYKLTPGKPEELVEISLFTQVWKKEGTVWKLARVVSYDHRLTD